MIKHILSVASTGIFLLIAMGQSPPMRLSTNVPTHGIEVEYSLVIKADSALAFVNLPGLRISGDDRFVITSGSSPPIEFTPTTNTGIPFNYTEGDVIQIAMLRSSTAFPDLLDAINSFITPPPLFQMTAEPPSGIIDRTAILNFSWQPDLYDYINVTERWNCTRNSLAYDQIIRATAIELASATYQIDVTARLNNFNSNNELDSVTCESINIGIEGLQHYRDIDLDPGLRGGRISIMRLKTYAFSLTP